MPLARIVQKRINTFARVVKKVNTMDLKSIAGRLVGSIPTLGTIKQWFVYHFYLPGSYQGPWTLKKCVAWNKTTIWMWWNNYGKRKENGNNLRNV